MANCDGPCLFHRWSVSSAFVSVASKLAQDECESFPYFMLDLLWQHGCDHADIGYRVFLAHVDNSLRPVSLPIGLEDANERISKLLPA